ncbi:hypothetical protein ACB092_06G133800 [Castanea dentata]
MGVGKKKLCCGVTSIFIVIIVIVILTLAFTIFKPRDPIITLYPGSNIEVTSFLNPTKNITLDSIITIENPNYGVFRYKNTTSSVTFRGKVVGEAPIMDIYVPPHKKRNMTSPVAIMPVRLIQDPHFWIDVAAGTLNLTSTVLMSGKVIAMNIFKRPATLYNSCNITVFILSKKSEAICESKLKV